MLIKYNTPSPHTQAILEPGLSGATDPEIEGARVPRRAALTQSPADVLDVDGLSVGRHPG